ncbi:MAG: helix-turn-helix domain-containing protein [Coriobacteriia bacterium]|nr:helix-turn-helix domain-containing protein [Coriobacteriia bacterium]
MILADKIIEHRKKNNWSQEELANKLGVSRQAISKWESAQSTPDLERILALSHIFGVSTDYLMKDDLEHDEHESQREESGVSVRKLTVEDANTFIEMRAGSSRAIALGVALTVLSPIPVLLSELWENNPLAEPISIAILLAFVGVAVALFLLNMFKMKPFEWISEEPFDSAYGVDGLVKEKLASYMPRFALAIIVSVLLFLAAAIAFVFSEGLYTAFQINENIPISFGFIFIAFGVYLLVQALMIKGTYTALLQEDDYAVDKKIFAKKYAPLFGIYWLFITIIYLAYSFITLNWEFSWIVWPIAALLFAIIYSMMEFVLKK